MKRLFDICGASLGLLLASPILLLCAIGVRLSSPGSVIYKQKRVGRGGVQFTLYKLRSMHVGSDAAGYQTQPNDSRIFGFGRFMRRLALDELPQLLNVLRGDMSLVGPRPCVPAQEKLYSAADWAERHQVQPGITGLAQLRLRSSGTLAEALALDLDYARNVSVLRDLAIILGTAAMMHAKPST